MHLAGVLPGVLYGVDGLSDGHLDIPACIALLDAALEWGDRRARAVRGTGIGGWPAGDGGTGRPRRFETKENSPP